MKVMVLVKGDESTEGGAMPTQEELAAMQRYNEELVKAGVMVAGEGLRPSSDGVRVRFEGSTRTVIDGPFAESKELIAGFWLWEVSSKEEAIEWLKKAPFDGGTEIELRPVFEDEDFRDQMTPEMQAKDAELRRQTENRQA